MSAKDVVIRGAGVLVVAGVLIGGGSYVIGDGGGDPADFYLATSGSDSNPGTSGSPFLTMDKCADQTRTVPIVCEMAAGTYAAQTLNDSAGARTATVTFRPASGAAVTVPTITNGDIGSISHDGQEFVTVTGITANYVIGTAGTNSWTLTDVDAKNFSCYGCTSTTWSGGDIGPCTAPAEGNCNVKIDADDGAVPTANTTSFVMAGATVHDVTSTDLAGSHIECMFLRNGDGLTISRTKFYGCHLYSIFIQVGSSTPTNITIENNWFNLGLDTTLDYSPGDNRAVTWGSCTPAPANMTVRFNSFPSTAGVMWDDCSNGSAPSASSVIYKGNVGRQTSPADGAVCYPGVTYTYNVFQSGATTCGTGDTTAASFGYVSSSTGSGGDFHLTGADWAADNLVPTSCGVTTDIDGLVTRPVGSLCDAGADER